MQPPWAMKAAPEAILITLPREARNAGKNACNTLKPPNTLTSNTLRILLCTSGESMPSRIRMPALLTRMSSVPISRPTRSASAAQAATSVMSSAKAKA
ncbi:hypothetical protein D3C78_1534050 [compost metagenome]